MQKIDKPQIVVSRCLGFSACRYDGKIIEDKFVNKLKEYVNFITVCPEMDIGLGVPRDTIRLVSQANKIILYQPASGKEYTKEMMNYFFAFLDLIKDVDGFIFKGRSPSCGIKDVKVYLGKKKDSGVINGTGIFATQIMKKYPYLAIEEEGRLCNAKIREHFLIKLYIMFKLRQVKKQKSMAEIVKFQAQNKYLLMAYNVKEQKVLGRIVANYDKRPFNILIDEYRDHLGVAFEKISTCSNYINALMHIFGYFSQHLSSNEKDLILGNLDNYKKSKIPLSVPLNLLHSYAIKYEQSYLLEQSIWSPCCENLMDTRDTSK
jgi:uncharacterized protein YbgA (DUF1722 family)/uncharacterized protein YbbK (DUF523 family)